MLDKLMVQTTLLEKGLDAVARKNQVISGNIANVDTPGYKAKRIDFESVFQDALSGGFPDEVDQIDDRFAVTPMIYEEAGTSLRQDGNNVDIDQEMADLAQNSILYDTLTYAISRELGQLKLVISEGK